MGTTAKTISPPRTEGEAAAEPPAGLRESRLPEEVAERIRARLAADPKLAALYLSLRRFSDLGTPLFPEADEEADSEH